MAERTAEDVKMNPVSGDVMRKGRVRKFVKEIRPPYMYWVSFVGRGEGPKVCNYISTWRKWAATAEVIHIAQSAGTAGEEA